VEFVRGFQPSGDFPAEAAKAVTEQSMPTSPNAGRLGTMVALTIRSTRALK